MAKQNEGFFLNVRGSGKHHLEKGDSDQDKDVFVLCKKFVEDLRRAGVNVSEATFGSDSTQGEKL